MEDEAIKAWVTINALTIGIQVVNGTVLHYGLSQRLRCADHTIHSKYWHRIPEAAIAHAEEMQRVKIASLKKRIEKLEKLEFKA